MIDINVVTFAVIFGGLTGAIVWDLITWYYGLPTSSSHALIGGYAGAAVAKAGFAAIIPSGWTQDARSSSSCRRSSAWSFGLGLMTAIFWLFRWTPPSRVDRWFRRLQLRVGRLLQPESRRQRRAEDDGDHRRRAVRGRLHPDVLHPVLGRS